MYYRELLQIVGGHMQYPWDETGRRYLGGIDGNVLRIKPPMCITKEDVDFLADVLDATLRSTG